VRCKPYKILLLFIVGFAFIACHPAAVYERIVIDTYSPNGSLNADTYMDLFDENGDPDADDPWIGDDTGDAIAFNDDGNPDWNNMARIDYTGGLLPGIYYIRVRGAVETVDDFYAIRVFSLNIGDSVPAYVFPGTDFLKPDILEPDDTPQSGGVPVSPVPIQLDDASGISRSLDDPTPAVADGNGDVDWFELVLP